MLFSKLWIVKDAEGGPRDQLDYFWTEGDLNIDVIWFQVFPATYPLN